jgi:hypothetical protein
MTADELDEWEANFRSFCGRFADIFGRKEPRAQAVKHLRGAAGLGAVQKQLAGGRSSR